MADEVTEANIADLCEQRINRLFALNLPCPEPSAYFDTGTEDEPNRHPYVVFANGAKRAEHTLTRKWGNPDDMLDALEAAVAHEWPKHDDMTLYWRRPPQLETGGKAGWVLSFRCVAVFP